MLMLSLVLFLTGAVLGLRFKVLVLIPAITLAVMAILARDVIHGDGVALIAVTAALAATCLQMGYLAGIVTRHATTLVRVGHPHEIAARPRSTSAPVRRHSAGGAAASTQYRG